MFGPICQVCKQRPATCHLTEVGPNQEIAELHICSGCIREHNLDLHHQPPAIAEILALAAGPSAAGDAPGIHVNLSAAAKAEAASGGPSCPTCGLELQEFVANNRFGCPDCYTTFDQTVVEMLSNLQDSDRHAGRTPHQAGDERSQRLAERLDLRQRLDAAIADEAYERAAELRDRLRLLDSEESA